MLRASAIVALVLTISLPSTAAASCTTAGQMVVLRSTDLDPDVFVWDAKQRAIDYAGGFWASTNDVMNHTTLAKPGTRAIVIACDIGAVRSKYAHELLDAIGVKILSGPSRGHYGWVTSEDVHLPAIPAH